RGPAGCGVGRRGAGFCLAAGARGGGARLFARRAALARRCLRWQSARVSREMGATNVLAGIMRTRRPWASVTTTSRTDALRAALWRCSEPFTVGTEPTIQKAETFALNALLNVIGHAPRGAKFDGRNRLFGGEWRRGLLAPLVGSPEPPPRPCALPCGRTRRNVRRHLPPIAVS